ncbi:MAG: M23 family metallopeptidase [Bacilli bacterium]|nr:M23 family metallopeptidase [Bacilli bacterium]
MTQRKVKKEVKTIVGLFGLSILIGVFTIIELTTNKAKPENEDQHVNKTIFENNIPVVATKEVISRPYTDNTVKIVTNYYNNTDDEETQKNSIIYFEDTYLPSTGINYQSDYDFDVVSILDGVVMSVKEDQTLGKIIEIKHKDNVISIYQSLSEILVKEGDEIKQGTIIAKSGTSNIQKDLGSHLHFELNINSRTVDPEDYYDKELGSI